VGTIEHHQGGGLELHLYHNSKIDGGQATKTTKNFEQSAKIQKSERGSLHINFSECQRVKKEIGPNGRKRKNQDWTGTNLKLSEFRYSNCGSLGFLHVKGD